MDIDKCCFEEYETDVAFWEPVVCNGEIRYRCWWAGRKHEAVIGTKEDHFFMLSNKPENVAYKPHTYIN